MTPSLNENAVQVEVGSIWAVVKRKGLCVSQVPKASMLARAGKAGESYSMNMDAHTYLRGSPHILSSSLELLSFSCPGTEQM